MSRVIFIEPPRADVDVSSALRFGDRVDLYPPSRRGRNSTPDGEAPRPSRPSVMHMEEYATDVLAQLSRIKYDPREDFFVLTGSAMSLCIAFAIITLQHGECRLLVFNASADEYVAKKWSPRALVA